MGTINKYGWIPDIGDKRDHFVSDYLPKTTARIALPDVINLRPQCAPVVDQLNLGRCTGAAFVNLYRFTDKEQNANASKQSMNFEYYWTRLLQGTLGQDSGASIRNALKAAAQYGVCLESLHPSKVSEYNKKPSDKAIAYGGKRKIKNYARVDEPAIIRKGKDAYLQHIRETLFAVNPIQIGFSVYQNFDEIGGNGIMPMPRGAVTGGHSVLVVGLDMKTRYAECQNSWGTSWGDKGFFKMPLDFLLDNSNVSDLWTLMGIEAVRLVGKTA